jgi:hypothetical protein
VQFHGNEAVKLKFSEPMLGVLGERTGVARGFAHLLFHRRSFDQLNRASIDNLGGSLKGASEALTICDPLQCRAKSKLRADPANEPVSSHAWCRTASAVRVLERPLQKAKL